MTPAQLAALTPEEREAWALCEVATDAPWADMGTDGAFAGEVRSCSKFAAVCRDPEMDDRPDDRAFIANARTSLPAALETIATLRAKIADAHDVVGQLFRAIAERDALRTELAAANRQIAELRTQLLDIGRGDPPPGWSASEDALFERALNADGSAMLYVYLPEDGRCAWEYSLEQPRTSVIERVPGGVLAAIATAERYAKENNL